jgi:o-succinylbenzoate synthase
MTSEGKLIARYMPFHLAFKNPSGTSKGVLTEKPSYFLIFASSLAPNIPLGIGEASIIPRISPDDNADYESVLKTYTEAITAKKIGLSSFEEANEWLPLLLQQYVFDLVPSKFPSIRFAAECALRGLANGNCHNLFQNDFSAGKTPLPINGLVWMNSIEVMRTQVAEKIAQGFNCIKLKIGALNFGDELALLQEIRAQHPADKLTLRVDANGAFTPEEALDKLDALAPLELHSIEQPIAKGNFDAMEKLCEESEVPIALDEELASTYTFSGRKTMLEKISPDFIVLKPSLLGGFTACSEWISLAESMGIGWWITSALESNVGLNAIAQFTANYEIGMPQGLGTGQLFEKNIASPLTIKTGNLHYQKFIAWETI